MKTFKICYEFYNNDCKESYWDMASAVVVEKDENAALVYFYEEVEDPSVKVHNVFEIGNTKEIIWAF